MFGLSRKSDHSALIAQRDDTNSSKLRTSLLVGRHTEHLPGLDVVHMNETFYVRSIFYSTTIYIACSYTPPHHFIRSLEFDRVANRSRLQSYSKRENLKLRGVHSFFFTFISGSYPSQVAARTRSRPTPVDVPFHGLPEYSLEVM